MSSQYHVYEFRQNPFGLYELRVHCARSGTKQTIPSFLRPRVVRGAGGLARSTSIGNYHGPVIEIDAQNKEYVLLDFVTARKTCRKLEGLGKICVVC